MACSSKITKTITNDCDNKPSAGLEVKAWAINRRDASFTLDGTKKALCTAIVNAAGMKAYPVTAVKKEMNVGADLVVSDILPDSYKHYFSFQPYTRSAEDIASLDNMTDIVIVAELKGHKTEGCFIILGLETGLHKSSMSFRANDNSGVPTYEFATRDGEEELYSRYVFWVADNTFAATTAALVAIETIP
jgi:hypothetical protein